MRVSQEYSFCFCALMELVENWYNFFPKCSVDFTSEFLLVWYFLFWWLFSIFSRYKPIHIFYFFLGMFWQIMSFKALAYCMQVIEFLGIEFIIFFYMCMTSVVISLFLYVTLVNYVLSLFFLSLQGSLLILLVFLKNQVLFLLIFSIFY